MSFQPQLSNIFSKMHLTVHIKVFLYQICIWFLLKTHSLGAMLASQEKPEVFM